MISLPTEQAPEDWQVPLRSVLEEIIEDVDDVRAISVSPLSRDNPSGLGITAYTGELQLHGEFISLYDSGVTWASLTNADGQKFVVPIFVQASTDGPPAPGMMMGKTPVYFDGNWHEVDSMTLDEGLERLRRKVGMPRDEVREFLRSVREQANDSDQRSSNTDGGDSNARDAS